MANFLGAVSKKVSDVRTFLRDSAGGNSIKYSAESGAKHQIYVPYITKEVDGAVVKELIAQAADIHEWKMPDGKYKATICTKGAVVMDDNGVQLTDGSCPFCDRVSDAWEVYRYRKEQEEIKCQLTGEQRKNHLEAANAGFREEMKAKAVKNYMYVLIVKFRTDVNGKEVLSDAGIPEYDLKVMKLSASRVEKIQQQLENAGTDMVGSEIIFGYPKNDDRRLVVSQSTTAPVFPDSRFTSKYPALLNKINEDVAKFQWDGVEKSFPELAGMSTVEAKGITDSLFENWDAYKKESLTNPNAKYLEYVSAVQATKPDINPVAPGIPVVPTVPGATPVVPGAPVAPVVPEIPAVPNMGVDPNAAFNGVTI